MIKKISERVWKLFSDSNVYFLDLEKKIIIDTSKRENRRELELFLKKVIDFDKVDYVIFTHLHHDHVGNFDLFKNARFFASSEEILDFMKTPEKAVLREDIAKMLKNINLEPVEELDLKKFGLELIKTPGHTNGSICLWYNNEKILFSGDTIFKNSLGRTDLPTSNPEKMKLSTIKLVKCNFRILCSGHDYDNSL